MLAENRLNMTFPLGNLIYSSRNDSCLHYNFHLTTLNALATPLIENKLTKSAHMYYISEIIENVSMNRQ